MKNKYYKIFFVIILLILNIGCNDKKIENENINAITNDINEVIKSVTVKINEQDYKLELEDNETVKSFIKLLPQEFMMNELNGNEKYVYLNTTLPINAYNPKKINAGDVMLYGNNCLVVFYKSFDTNYSYTKIGHINNLQDLGNMDIRIMFEKR